jgi:hypothetical protein
MATITTNFRKLLLLLPLLFRQHFVPRLPCIQTGVRDVPPDLSEHPEDLYDALEIEFNKAMIHNQSRRNKAQLTFKERSHMIRHLTMTEAKWVIYRHRRKTVRSEIDGQKL